MPKEVTAQTVSELFSYHRPSEAQVDQMKPIREKARELALIIHEKCPSNSDVSAALRLLRQAVMSANSSIMLHEWL